MRQKKVSAWFPSPWEEKKIIKERNEFTSKHGREQTFMNVYHLERERGRVKIHRTYMNVTSEISFVVFIFDICV